MNKELYQRNIEPSKGEKQLLRLNEGNVVSVINDLREDLSQGKSPSHLSIAKTPLLYAVAREWQKTEKDFYRKPTTEYKTTFFEKYLHNAGNGKPESIQTLFKFITSPEQMREATEIVLTYTKDLQEWQHEQKYVQYTGTFDPQHIGHRIAVASALNSAGEDTNAIIQVMGSHPLKPSISTSYEERFRVSEEKLYKSPLIKTTKTTQIDVPGGMGLGTSGIKQLQLIADTCGDPKIRWLIGSDKFIMDTKNIYTGEYPRATFRLSHPRTEIYVIHRKSDNSALIEQRVQKVLVEYNKKVSIIEEIDYDCAPASSTKIKELRSKGEFEAAYHMEYYELNQSS